MQFFVEPVLRGRGRIPGGPEFKGSQHHRETLHQKEQEEFYFVCLMLAGSELRPAEVLCSSSQETGRRMMSLVRDWEGIRVVAPSTTDHAT